MAILKNVNTFALNLNKNYNGRFESIKGCAY